MKMEEVTLVSFDDYVRQQKVRGEKVIKWDESGWNILRQFTDMDFYLGMKHEKEN